jgi:serine protease Do
MQRASSRWIAAGAGLVALGGLFYALRTDTPTSQPIAPKAATDASTASSRAAAATAEPASRAPANAATTDLSPKAAAQAPAVPNFVDLVQAVKPAVVSIRVKSDVTPEVMSGDGGGDMPFEGTPFGRFFQPFGRGEQAPQRHFFAQAQGSGFFISADGYVVTNNHVVAKAVQLQVVTDDGRTLDAKVVGVDPKTDLALLKVEGRQLPFVTLADALPKTGEWVIAMGNPFGLGGTVTAGIVSAQGRDIGAGPYDDFLQIDAAVNRGNSGGPTFDLSGRVVGVNTAIYSPSGGNIGIAFAIPATTVKVVVAQLKEKGHVERGFIGVQVQPVTKEIADSLGMKDAQGALVASIQPGSPAARAGLKPGDVITLINGASIKDARDLARQVAAIAPNVSVKVEFLRDGKQQTLQVTMGHDPAARQRPRPPQPDAAGQTGGLGMAVAPAARVMGLGEEGLAVLRVDPAGRAADAGINPGDVILQVGGKQVSSADELARAIEAAAAQRKQHVLALVRRNDRQMFMTLPIGTG